MSQKWRFVILAGLLLIIGVFSLLQLLAGRSFPVTYPDFTDASYKVADKHLLDAPEIGVNTPILASNTTSTPSTLVWLKRATTKQARWSSERNSWHTNTIESGTQTATNWRDFGYLVLPSGREVLVQAAASDGLSSSYRDPDADSWSAPKILAPEHCKFQSCGHISLAWDETNGTLYGVYVATHHQTQRGLYLMTSTDRGRTWNAPQFLSGIPYGSPAVAPTLRVNQGNFFLLYGHTLYHATDSNQKWLPEYTLLGELGPAHGQLEVSAAGDVFLAWHAKEITDKNINIFSDGYVRGNEYILFTKRTTSGWSDPQIVNDIKLRFDMTVAGPDTSTAEYFREQSNLPQATEVFDIAISPDGNTIGVFWKDTRLDTAANRFTASTNAGNTWSPNLTLHSGSAIALTGALATDQDAFHASWVQHQPNPENHAAITQPTELMVSTITPTP